MFCRNCGRHLSEDSLYCTYCGEKVYSHLEVSLPKQEKTKRRGFGLSLASTILGAISLLRIMDKQFHVGWILAIIGLILGIIGLVKGINSKIRGGYISPMVLGIIGTSLSFIGYFVASRHIFTVLCLI